MTKGLESCHDMQCTRLVQFQNCVFDLRHLTSAAYHDANTVTKSTCLPVNYSVCLPRIRYSDLVIMTFNPHKQLFTMCHFMLTAFPPSLKTAATQSQFTVHFVFELFNLSAHPAIVHMPLITSTQNLHFDLTCSVIRLNHTNTWMVTVISWF